MNETFSVLVTIDWTKGTPSWWHAVLTAPAVGPLRVAMAPAPAVRVKAWARRLPGWIEARNESPIVAELVP
jgi:hypothetical protein